MFDNYSRVRLTTDRFQSAGVNLGSVGYIIETYPPDAYEVEFSDDNGVTFAQIVARHDELALAPETAPALISF